MNDYYQSADEIRSLVSEFEACSFHPSEFRHHQHLAVAVLYVANLPYAHAIGEMKRGIQRLATRYGKTGYHGKVTQLWVGMVRGFLPEGERTESSVGVT